MPNSIGGVNLSHIDDTLVDDDPEIEYMIAHWLVDEDGSILFENQWGNSLSINKTDGLVPKLISSTNVFQIYGLPGLALEQTYTRYMQRKNFTQAGEKWYFEDTQNAIVQIYNNPDTLWKSIPLPTPPQYIFGGITTFDDSFIVDDPKVEVGYYYYQNGGGYYEARVINEDGTNYWTIPNSGGIYPLKLEGHADKLQVSNIQNGLFYSDVYGIDNALGIAESTTSNPLVYPNPASDVVYINSQKNISNVSVYDAQGHNVASFSANAITQIATARLDAGIYLLVLHADDGSQVNAKILKN